MSEYTKGPWVIRQDDESNPHSALSVYGNEPAGFVCRTSGNCGPNARLIAAAPELLEALSELVDEINLLASESCGVAGLHLNGDVATWEEILPGGRFEWLGGLERAESAIAKATEEPYATDERTQHSWS